MKTGQPNSFDAIAQTINNRYEEAPNLILNKFDPRKYIKRAGDDKKEIIREYHEGKPRAFTTNIPQMDPVFKWNPGFLYCITGWPGHGKSELIRFLAMMKALKVEWRTSFYSPESHPSKRFFEGAAKMLTGKSSVKKHRNAMNDQELSNAIDFCHEYFYFIGDEFSRPLSPEQVREVNEYIHAMTPLNISVSDPWNKHKHDMRGRSIDNYLSDVLPEEQAFARANNICKVILAHPKTGEKLKRGEEQPLPGPDWLHGGQMWDNMCDVIGAVHRPNFWKPGGRTSEEVVFATFKVKDQSAVEFRPGGVDNIRFAFFESRYYFDNTCPMVEPGIQPEYQQLPLPMNPLPASEFDNERVEQLPDPF